MKISIGNRKLNILELVTASFDASDEIHVTLDATVLSRLGQGKKGEEKDVHEDTPVPLLATKQDCALSKENAKLLMLYSISRCMNFRTYFQSDIVVAWVELLRQGIVPLLSLKDSNVGNTKDNFDLPCLQLLEAAKGLGLCYFKNEIVPISQAVKSTSFKGVSLISHMEVASFAKGSFTATAISYACAAGATALLQFCEMSGALTCEAIKAFTSPFDAEYHENNRAHRGAITTAANLRLYLENSKMVNSRKEANTYDHDCIRCIPQYLGSVRDSIAATVNAMNIELNCVNVGGWDTSCDAFGPFHPQPMATALTALKTAVDVLLATTNERISFVSQTIQESTPAFHGSGERDRFYPMEALAVLDSIYMAHQAITFEVSLSLQLLKKTEEELIHRLAEKVSNTSLKDATTPTFNQPPPEASLEGMSEEKRRKVEEKRAKKLAAKEAKEAAKGGGSTDLLKLGLGTAEVRRYLLAHWNQDLNRDRDRVLNNLLPSASWLSSTTPLEKVLCPFQFSVDSFFHFLEDLLIRLNSSRGQRRKPKVAKGAQDFLPEQMNLREKIFNKIKSIFKRHGGVEIETPVFELKETLTGKYGEDSKLIYDLADQGGELLALRYDLTVPFARYMALHNPGNIKRYHIARVYRRDNPQMARGRFREFYQCDFDIAGTYGSMMSDAEILSIAIEILTSFPEIGPFVVKLSHRRLLDAILAICGVPREKTRAICSAIDKLDKESWEDVKLEMVEEKGLDPAAADRIEKYVCRKGAPKLLHEQLVNEKLFVGNADASAAMTELKTLFDYLDALNVLDFISFDLSLARGLDYYTGLIYECVLTSATNVGSIAAGGRYDTLVGMFSTGGQDIPCIGISLGIERIFNLLQKHAEEMKEMKKPISQVLVASTTGNMTLAKLDVLQRLWKANIASEMMQVLDPKFTKQLHYALEVGFPYMVIVGEEEERKGVVKVKNIETKHEYEVTKDTLVEALLREGCKTTTTLEF